MKSLQRSGTMTIVLGGLALLSARHVAAQQTVAYPELDRIHEEAMALAYASAPGSLERAAWSHGHVAYLRPVDDVHRFECLRTQAQLLQAIGETDGARFYLEEAAIQAREIGDDFNAAMTYIDAAILELDAGHDWEAWDLGRQARSIASDGKMEQAQRRAILDRLGTR
jgi:hypothetical protein